MRVLVTGGAGFVGSPPGASAAVTSRTPVFRRRLSWFTTNRAFRIDRARRELGHSPRVTLQDGLQRTATWYREEGYPLSLALAVLP